jgi:hypothetical protein
VFADEVARCLGAFIRIAGGDMKACRAEKRSAFRRTEMIVGVDAPSTGG